jgi:hypothetical protein
MSARTLLGSVQWTFPNVLPAGSESYCQLAARWRPASESSCALRGGRPVTARSPHRPPRSSSMRSAAKLPAIWRARRRRRFTSRAWGPLCGDGASRRRLGILCVFRLNANLAFSVGANVSSNSQSSAWIALIQCAVAIPSFWLALSELSAPRTAMEDAAFADGHEHNRCRFRPLSLYGQRLY